MSSNITAAAKAASEANASSEIFLYELELDDGTACFVSPGTIPYTIGSNTYIPWPVSHGPVKQNVKLQVLETQVAMDNVPQQLSAYAANGGIINGRKLTIYQIDRTLVDDPLNKILIISGKMDGFSFDTRNFTATVKCSFTKWNDEVPDAVWGTNCQLKFKRCYCGYTGIDTICSKTREDCAAKGNLSNFVGFSSVPKELVVR